MIYVFDIDETICGKVENGNYQEAEPWLKRIEIINNLYLEGHTIVYQTARGMGRHKNNPILAIQDFYDVTKNQLERWGAKYHCLILGKPMGDYYVDDKGINADAFFKE